jgi:superfamily II DNA/RNA helicase
MRERLISSETKWSYLITTDLAARGLDIPEMNHDSLSFAI